MNFRPLIIGALALASTVAVTNQVATAHHSTTIYDLRARVPMEGVVRQFRWTQPHAFVIIDVAKKGGGTERWNVEIGTPSVNSRMGWKKSDIKAGDKISMTVHPVRTGAKHATASIVNLADGRTLYGPAAGLSGLMPRG